MTYLYYTIGIIFILSLSLEIYEFYYLNKKRNEFKLNKKILTACTKGYLKAHRRVATDNPSEPLSIPKFIQKRMEADKKDLASDNPTNYKSINKTYKKPRRHIRINFPLWRDRNTGFWG